MITKTAISNFQKLETPLFYYDMDLLRETLSLFKKLLDKYGIVGHYALKANANDRILKAVLDHGIGAECATGNEVSLAVASGFAPENVVFAGVAKTDKEIVTALKADIACFNCESIQEIQVIDELAGSLGKRARIAIRVNPNVDAHTHKYITTGLKENKFGISPWAFDEVLKVIKASKNIDFTGLHFHVGSQITDMSVFKELCIKVNVIENWFEEKGVNVKSIDLGGGLGVDYDDPDKHPVPTFEEYLKVIHDNLKVKPGQIVRVEPGRAVVAQCGYLITRATYVKNGMEKKFVILDAGMNNLIRPALYDAHHKVENITSDGKKSRYDVVGAVCESSDTFAANALVNETRRGDIFAIHSAGAYGQVMNMRYNQRDLAKAYYSDDFNK
ncbi:MAG: diaminopimelate decarboxylase [Bacteroidales bacterium]|nr:diaminopimelate decarboxylase [Bacteroidales bacterium]